MQRFFSIKLPRWYDPLLLVLLGMILGSCSVRLHGAEAPTTKAPVQTVKEMPRAVTADDLQNLVVCARRALPTLTADELAAVAQSIKHAETDIATMRSAEAGPPTPEKKP